MKKRSRKMDATETPGCPQFTAALLLKQPVQLSFDQIRTELKRVAPRVTLGDWDGPVTGSADDTGIEMLSLNGEKMSLLNVDAPAPASVLEAGPFPNPLWPDPAAEAAAHKAHIVVIGLGDPVDRKAALAKARAVTLLTAAIARLVPAIGATWADSANLVKAAAFIGMTEGIGQPEANAVPFWVRLMLAQGPSTARGEQTIMAGTLGLRIFGLRELEYAPAPLDPEFIVQHAYSVSEYLLRSGKRLRHGETIGVEGQSGFAVSHADSGDFVSYPVARLSFQHKSR
jgi:hypothetical protein